MHGDVIYAEQITEVFIGRPELQGYGCEDACIRMNGYIAQSDRKTVYFDCSKDKNLDECKYLRGFLKEGQDLGLKRKYGNKDEIMSDLVEALEHPKATGARIPFRTNVADEHFSPENVEKFFKAFMGYETRLEEVMDARFVLVVKKDIKKRKPLENIKNAITKYFLKKG
jgi:hypothetical protein